MPNRRFTLIALTGLFLAVNSAPALAQDTQICFAAADRVTKDGETLSEQEKGAAHEACLRALAETSSVVHKYHLQEADFDIMGTRPKQP